MTIDCVLNGVPVTVPGGASRALTAANGYEALYDSLPVGAVCGVAESVDGGASTVEILDDAGNDISEVTVVEAVTVDVVVINTFDLGSVVVTKELSGDIAAAGANPVFTIEFSCVWHGAALAVPGGASRQLSVGNPVAYGDLPIGADCTLVETDAGGADKVTMTPADGANSARARVVVAEGAATSITVDNTFVSLPVTGSNPLVWLLPVGSALLLFGAGFVMLTLMRRKRETV